ncbi:MAG: integrase arm-type DNA-binding domain-containing protein [Boseongicola sp.]|nr:integrase arm-type DNA-binding domain-containing protein [Boseongicola sp.]
MTLTARTVDTLQPGDSPYIAWDDRLIGFGVRVHPSGLRSYLVNYRAGDGQFVNLPIMV